MARVTVSVGRNAPNFSARYVLASVVAFVGFVFSVRQLGVGRAALFPAIVVGSHRKPISQQLLVVQRFGCALEYNLAMPYHADMARNL